MSTQDTRSPSHAQPSASRHSLTRTVLLLPRPTPGHSSSARPLRPVSSDFVGDAGLMQWHDLALADAWASVGGVLPRVHAIACWSGGGGGDHEEERPGLFDADPRSWGPAGLAALSSFVDGVVLPSLRRSSARLWLRPHARHVLCDSVRAERFVLARVSAQPAPGSTDALDAANAGGVRLMADPSALLTRSMLARADDHFERAMESIARVHSGGGLGAVVLTNIAGSVEDNVIAATDATPDPDAFTADDGPALVPSPLHRGVLRPVDILGALGRWLDPATPLVLLDDEVDEQLELLRASGVQV